MLVNIGGDESSDSESSSPETGFLPQFKRIVTSKMKPRIETTTRPRDSSDENPDAGNEEPGLDNSPMEAPASPDRSASPLPIIDVDNETDLDVLRNQVKVLMQKFRKVSVQNENMTRRFRLEKAELNNQLAAANIQATDQRDGLCRNLLQALEHELNCCICNEVFMHVSELIKEFSTYFFCILTRYVVNKYSVTFLYRQHHSNS